MIKMTHFALYASTNILVMSSPAGPLCAPTTFTSGCVYNSLTKASMCARTWAGSSASGRLRRTSWARPELRNFLQMFKV